jgi:uncharacterized protein (DUF1778 family)
MVTARLDMRLDKEIKAKAEKAMALLGHKSLTDYIVKLMDEDASQVIAQHESLIVEDDIFDRFLDACNKVRSPNKALIEAATFTKEHGIK